MRNRRKHERRAPSDQHALSVWIEGDGPFPTFTQVVDYSPGGLGLWVRVVPDEVGEGSAVRLRVWSLDRGAVLGAEGRVVRTAAAHGGRFLGIAFDREIAL